MVVSLEFAFDDPKHSNRVLFLKIMRPVSPPAGGGVQARAGPRSSVVIREIGDGEEVEVGGENDARELADGQGTDQENVYGGGGGGAEGRTTVRDFQEQERVGQRASTSGEDEVAGAFTVWQPGSSRKRRRRGGLYRNPDENAAVTVSYYAMERTREVHVITAVLASHSPFFMKLLFNDMGGSNKEGQTSLEILESEENAFIRLLQFMYSVRLQTADRHLVCEILELADKYEVPACLEECCTLLMENMTSESAMQILDLPDTLSSTPIILTLVDTAKGFLFKMYRDICQCPKPESLTFSAVKLLLLRDDLDVQHEDSLYEFIRKWSEARFEEEEGRQKAEYCYTKLLRLPYLSWEVLAEMIKNDLLDSEDIPSLLFDVLRFRYDDITYRQRSVAPGMSILMNPREYTLIQTKVLQFELPYAETAVYFNIRKEQIAQLYPAGELASGKFMLAGHSLCLIVVVAPDQQTQLPSFGLVLEMFHQIPEDLHILLEVSSRRRPGEFRMLHRSVLMIRGGRRTISSNLFSRSWELFMAEECNFFIGDTIFFRVYAALK